jgi:glycosyltransferase involved in cell wall biosynthesis
MRVAYDAQAFVSGDGGTGKGLQLRNLVNSKWAAFEGYAPPSAHRNSVEGVRQAGHRHYLLWQQASLPRLLQSSRPDIFLAPYNTAPLWLPGGTKLILVLHDLILLHDFKAATARKRVENLYRRTLIRPSVARASQVLTVSEFSKKEILREFPGARVSVIPCTIAESWFTGSMNAIERQRDNYILLVTAAPEHKNSARALRAYARYVHMAGTSAADLRIVGLSYAGGPFRELVEALGLKEKVVFEPFISSDTLQQLYRRAKAVLVPSLIEGFGIPVLEGMASGTPVLASQSSSMSEVGGEAARYFDPLDETSMATSIFNLLNDAAIWLEAARKGRLQAAKFHPNLVLRQIDAFWRRLATSREPLPLHS